MWDTFWHKLLRRPYQLATPVHTGGGIPVVFLHGIGRSSAVWRQAVAILEHKPFQLIAFDLLGFGASPKPQWSSYDVDVHAKAVIYSLHKARISGQIILVGHSMGCLVAVRVAYLRPDLVRHLVLYEMPLYAGLPDKRIYQLRLKLYTSMYNRVLTYQPSFGAEKRRLAERLAKLLQLPEPTPESWRPFIRSLENTIMHQQTAHDIKQLSMPMDVIYGSRDMLVIRGKVQTIFGQDAKNISAYTLKAGHTISPRASQFLADRIQEAVSRHPSQTVRLSKRRLRLTRTRSKHGKS